MKCTACNYDSLAEKNLPFIETDFIVAFQFEETKDPDRDIRSVYLCPKCGTLKVSLNNTI